MSVSSREERILGIIETARAKRPRFKDERITMAHGAGGKATQTLIEGLLAPAFGIEELGDAAAIEDVALTTDSFVVKPLRFPGGSIGELAVNGTVNDLAMAGARPLALSLALILEEGLEAEILRTEVDAIASTSARRTSLPRPSSRIIATLSASGRAPATARSLTVPLTASSPIEPPGKRSGLTTNESVVNASSSRIAASASSSIPKAGASSPSISVCVALPPAPWAIVIRSSRKRGLFARAVSMIERIRSSRSETVTRPPARGRTGRRSSRRRTRPPATPCTSRSRARACRRCRTPCTPTA